MRINNLEYLVEELGGDELFEDEMYLAIDNIDISDQVHFLATSERREKIRKKQMALKKENLDGDEKFKHKS